jgi:uncharacterized protein
MMESPFWNREEKRPRAVWRLLLHTIFLFTALFVLNMPVVFLAAILSGPGEFMGGSGDIDQLLADLISSSPLLVILSAVFTLLAFLVATWLAARKLDKRRFASYGFHFSRLWRLDLLFGLALGALLMLGIFAFQLSLGWVEVTGTFTAPGTNFAAGISAAAVLFIGVGIQEELLSRGYHLRNIAEGSNHPSLSSRAALLIGYAVSSALFGVLHILNPNTSLISTTNLLLAGLFLGLGYLLTGELGIPIGLHITWNFFQGNVFGFPVSGSQLGVTFIQIRQGGPELWTGGPFGPEAGLIGIAAMLVGSLLTVAWVLFTRGSVELQTHLAEYSPAEQMDALSRP